MRKIKDGRARKANVVPIDILCMRKSGDFEAGGDFWHALNEEVKDRRYYIPWILELEKEVKRLKKELLKRRLRRWGPWVFSAAMVALFFWLARK